MLYKFFSMTMLPCLLAACASTHSGSIGKSLLPQAKLPIQVSAQNIDADKNSAFQLIDVTIENTSDSWLKINTARVVIDHPAESKLSVVLGKDLNDWAQAESLRQKQEQHNKEMLQLGLVGAGAAASILSGRNTGLGQAGSAVMIGTTAWVLTDAVVAQKNAAQNSEKVPENHLYHSASVPAKMYLRRWVLINKPIGHLLKTVVIEFETIEGEKENYAITF